MSIFANFCPNIFALPLSSLQSLRSHHSTKIAIISCWIQGTAVTLHLTSLAASDRFLLLKTFSSLLLSPRPPLKAWLSAFCPLPNLLSGLCSPGLPELPQLHCLTTWSLPTDHLTPLTPLTSLLLHLNVLTPPLSLILRPFWRANPALFYLVSLLRISGYNLLHPWQWGKSKTIDMHF